MHRLVLPVPLSTKWAFSLHDLPLCAHVHKTYLHTYSPLRARSTWKIDSFLKKKIKILTPLLGVSRTTARISVLVCTLIAIDSHRAQKTPRYAVVVWLLTCLSRAKIPSTRIYLYTYGSKKDTEPKKKKYLKSTKSALAVSSSLELEKRGLNGSPQFRYFS